MNGLLFNPMLKVVHFIGLLSDGGVHAHIDHVKGLCDAAKANGLTNVFIHAFLDGRDTDPKSGKQFLEELESNLHGARIASICGRYYSMDRDNRWERVKLAYDLIVNGIGKHTINLVDSIAESYANNVTDEFIHPLTVVDKNDKPIATIQNDDVVIFFNFRTDRGRQLTEVLSQNDNHEFNMHKLNLHYVTMTNYDDNFKNIQVI